MRRSSLHKRPRSTPRGFDAAFGLERLHGDEDGADCSEGPVELCGMALVSEFFLGSPEVITTYEDAAPIAVKSGGHAEAPE
ncbi:MAG: hypothetical protein ACRD4S_09080 [Candidatus Acidiferrales bacterium]